MSAESFEEWRDRTAAPRSAPVRSWTVREALTLGVGLGLGSLVPLGVGMTYLGELTGLVAVSALLMAAVLAWVPDKHQPLADALSVIALAALAGLVRMLADGSFDDAVALAIGVAIVAALRLRGWYALR